MPLSYGEYGGSEISVMFAGTTRSLERWKPAPSQIKAAWTSGAGARENWSRNWLMIAVFKTGERIALA